MEFNKLVKKVRDQLIKADTSQVDGTIAFQFDLTGEDGGTFYIEIKDHVLSVEPYEYIDKNGLFTVSTKDFMNIANRKTDIMKAYAQGKVNFQGDIQKALLLKDLFPPVKPAKSASKSKAKKEVDKAKVEEQTEAVEQVEKVKETKKTNTEKSVVQSLEQKENVDDKTDTKVEEKPKSEPKRKTSSKKSSTAKSTATSSK